VAFAFSHDARPELARKPGDLKLALGKPREALAAYEQAAPGAARDAELRRRIARAEALLGEVDIATAHLRSLMREPGDLHTQDKATLDLARLQGTSPPGIRGGRTPEMARRIAMTWAWSRPDEPQGALDAARSLVLAAEPAACAAELIETAALSRFAGITIDGLSAAAAHAAQILENPRTRILLNGGSAAEARRTFLHWDA
jgi:hypothetical protein